MTALGKTKQVSTGLGVLENANFQKYSLQAPFVKDTEQS